MTGPTKRRAKLSMACFTVDPLKVVVGKDESQKMFYIQKELICSESEFFAIACKDAWKSGRDNTVTLAENDPEIFGVFLVWLTTRDIQNADGVLSLEFVEQEFGKGKQNDAFKDATVNSASAQFDLLARCYGFGDFIQSMGFCNCAMDHIISISHHVWKGSNKIIGVAARHIKLVYPLTKVNSRLRQFCIDTWVTSVSSKWVEANIEFYLGRTCDDFLKAIIPRLMVKETWGKEYYPDEYPWVFPWRRQPAYYHLKPTPEMVNGTVGV
ncbi:hypothetical protein GLAREA_08604 [Glarea lozoyensis ATCC 20868]|uniref:BTB domain-containing protein n=1 Tax=Glarea lozoyensis (strain ATCC 20868 / MF5171) TaxID=1116229 RepID=S3CY70_GLAL2|nr:uncharacterized protein GLAREA_08604 [Glarea lozoyensis ATCC 20868]EPE24751.1 hypothetical protein GLAREA_08604 [Glarea lozoyensis ATCC 20868]